MPSLLKEDIFLYSSTLNTWRGIAPVIPSCVLPSHHLAVTPKSNVESRSSSGREWTHLFWNIVHEISCRNFDSKKKNHSRCSVHRIILIISVMMTLEIQNIVLFRLSGSIWTTKYCSCNNPYLWVSFRAKGRKERPQQARQMLGAACAGVSPVASIYQPCEFGK